MKKLVLVISALAILSSCTEQQRAKKFGGTAELEIPAGRKFVNSTWKEDNLWILTEDSSYYYFTESSSYGLIEGEIKFKK